MLTATPMQVHPVEVWDLLSILGLPPEWTETAFLKFCEAVDHSSPVHEDMEFLAGMFRATEQRYGPATEQDARRAGATTGLRVAIPDDFFRPAEVMPSAIRWSGCLSPVKMSLGRAGGAVTTR
jgi:hypothetical protein